QSKNRRPDPRLPPRKTRFQFNGQLRRLSGTESPAWRGRTPAKAAPLSAEGFPASAGRVGDPQGSGHEARPIVEYAEPYFARGSLAGTGASANAGAGHASHPGAR